MHSWAITYNYEIVPSGKVSLVLAPGYDCELETSGNSFGDVLPPRNEIGLYRYKLDSAVLDPLLPMVQDAIREEGAQGHEVIEGATMLNIGFGTMDQELKLASFCLQKPLPPATKRFDERMMDVAKQLFKHPYRTLAAVGAWQVAEIGSLEPLQIRLTLRNSGVVPLQVQNPAAEKGDQRTGVRLALTRDVPAEQETAEDIVFLDAEGWDAVQVAAPGAGTDAKPQKIVTLKPEQELVLLLSARRHLFLAPGQYQGRLFFNCAAEGIPEDKAVEGELYLELGPLDVVRK